MLLLLAAPDAPQDVKLVSCQHRFAHLQWKLLHDNYSPVTQFVLQYNTSFQPNVWQEIRSNLPPDKHYQRIELSPWANYSFRVIAQNAIGRSEPSEPTKEMCIMPPDVPHHNPKHVCTKNGVAKTLAITWQVCKIKMLVFF